MLPTLPVHAAPLTYTLTLSTSRTQETNNPGVMMTLNINNTTPGQILGFSWNVTDPAGSQGTFFSGASANGPSLTLSAVYPRDFTGILVKYNGTYRINIYQTLPGPPTLVATSKFYSGLSDSLVYQRASRVSILAQGYASSENLTIRISHSGVPATGFPASQQADPKGVFNYVWTVPISAPLGNYNVSLSGQTTIKKPSDSQLFTVIPTTVAISPLIANVTMRGSSVFLSFTASYPDGSQAKTGTGTISLLEPNGSTNHTIAVSYNSTINAFQGTYSASSSMQSGVWVAVVAPDSFDDGYGNVGPSTITVIGFAVEPLVSPNSQSSILTYLLLVIVILLAGVLSILAWVIFGRKKVQRNVLKVDFQSIEREAARVQNRDFFARLHDQLKQRQQTKPEEETKNG